MLETNQHQEQQEVKVIHTTEDSGKAIVSILYYDADKHRMDDHIHIQYSSLTNLSPEEQKLLEQSIQPSDEWMEDYQQWNKFGGIVGAPPTFGSLHELREFNAKGAELAERLQNEIETNGTACKVFVAPFKPIYSNVAVGDAVCAWWHVKDMSYDFVIPIQKLPISDQLKAHFQVWRHRKLQGWRDPEIRAELNLEGHDLEEHLVYELTLAPLEEVRSDTEQCFQSPTSVARMGSIPTFVKKEHIASLSQQQDKPLISTA